jgi:probable HAF family extracellular repeat protein
VKKFDRKLVLVAVFLIGLAFSQPMPVFCAALLWTEGGGMVALPGLHIARGINNLGQVVGQGYSAAENQQRVFLWTEGSGVLDLGTLGGTDSQAYNTNDLGLTFLP